MESEKDKATGEKTRRRNHSIFAELTWFPQRRCFLRKYRKQKKYFYGDKSGYPTERNYEVALREFSLWKADVDLALDSPASTKASVASGLPVEQGEAPAIAPASAIALALAPVAPVAPAPAKPKAKTLRKVADIWLESEFTGRMKSKKIAVSYWDKVRRYLDDFCLFVGNDTLASAIAETELTEYRVLTNKQIASKAISDYYGKYRLQTIARFVSWLWENRYVEDLPRNIKSFCKVEVELRERKSFTKEEIQALWGACKNNRQRLYIALGLNTAMNQADMATLKPEEYAKPYLCHKREKTGVKAKWLLWGITQELIGAERESVGDLLFRTREGKPILDCGLKDNRRFRSDSVKLCFEKLAKKARVKGNFAMIRKTVATTATALGYGDCVGLLLSHAPKTIADRHYVEAGAKYESPRLEECLKALESYFGLTLDKPENRQ